MNGKAKMIALVKVVHLNMQQSMDFFPFSVLRSNQNHDLVKEISNLRARYQKVKLQVKNKRYRISWQN